ncbi:hypothetical protein EfmGK941_25480 [Enterococcus faecium]|nr:hypothetical protein EfmGK941_25480 [Enterococcus faecium]
MVFVFFHFFLLFKSEKHEVKVGESWEKGKYKAADNNITYTVASNKKQKVTVPVYAYLGTQVKVNGKVLSYLVLYIQ